MYFICRMHMIYIFLCVILHCSHRIRQVWLGCKVCSLHKRQSSVGQAQPGQNCHIICIGHFKTNFSSTRSAVNMHEKGLNPLQEALQDRYPCRLFGSLVQFSKNLRVALLYYIRVSCCPANCGQQGAAICFWKLMSKS